VHISSPGCQLSSGQSSGCEGRWIPSSRVLIYWLQSYALSEYEARNAVDIRGGEQGIRTNCRHQKRVLCRGGCSSEGPRSACAHDICKGGAALGSRRVHQLLSLLLQRAAPFRSSAHRAWAFLALPFKTPRAGSILQLH